MNIPPIRILIARLFLKLGIPFVYRPTTAKAMSQINYLIEDLKTVASYQLDRAIAASDREAWWEDMADKQMAKAREDWEESIKERDEALSRANAIGAAFGIEVFPPVPVKVDPGKAGPELE